MARRYAGKTSSRNAVVRDRGRHSKTKAAATVTAESTLKERLTALERERDALRDALAKESSRVRELEQLNAQARDRISWALDALHSILQPKR